MLCAVRSGRGYRRPWCELSEKTCRLHRRSNLQKVMTSFLLTAWITCFVACVQLYCVISTRFRLVLLSSVSGTSAEDIGRYTVAITSYPLPTSVETRMPRVSKFIRILTYGFRCTLAMILSLFSDDQPQLQLFSQMALDRLCDLQLVTGTAILIAGIAELDTMSFYHQSLVLSYWLLTLNAFWAARAGYLSSDHYGNDRSIYFWTRWVAILISDILSIYYQIETTLEAANHWDSSKSGHCYLSHEPSSTNSQYFWIVGITVEVLYMILYTIHRIIHSLPSRFQLLKTLSNSIVHTSKELAEESRHGADNLRKNVRLNTQTLWTPLRIVVICLELILVGAWWFIWRVLALWAWGDSASVAIVLGYIALAAWNTFDVLDTKLSNRDLVIGDESDWGFGQILPLGLLALICLDLLDIVNSKS
jgi:hypothetical protein